MDPAHSTAFGSGISGNTLATMSGITIQARDVNGNPILVGGDIFLVKVNGIPYFNLDNGDGSYSSQYFTVTAGDYLVDISSSGIQIASSPFTVPFA